MMMMMMITKIYLLFATIAISSIYGDEIIDLWNHSDRTSTVQNNLGGESAYYMSEIYVFGSMRHSIGASNLYNYALLTEEDVTALGSPLNQVNWENYFNSTAPLSSNDIYFTGDQFYGFKYLIFINWTNRNNSLTDHFFTLNSIQFNLMVYECVDNSFEFSLSSTIKNLKPALGNVTIVGSGLDDCKKDVIVDSWYSDRHFTDTIVFNKNLCQIEYDTPFKIVYSYDWLVSELNTQIFNAECRQDFTSLVLNTGVTNIDVIIDEIQHIFDFALASQMLIVSDTNDPTSVVSSETLGAEVGLYISLPSTYRFDFDITVKDCYVDGELVLKDGVSQIPQIFGEFNESIKGVSTNKFHLFKSLDHLQSRDILFSCMVETCLDDCSIEPEPESESGFKRRRRRSIISSHKSDALTEFNRRFKKLENVPLHKGLNRFEKLISHAQRRIRVKN